MIHHFTADMHFIFYFYLGLAAYVIFKLFAAFFKPNKTED